MELVPGCAMGACYSLYKGVLREPAIACTRVCYKVCCYYKPLLPSLLQWFGPSNGS